MLHTEAGFPGTRCSMTPIRRGRVGDMGDGGGSERAKGGGTTSESGSRIGQVEDTGMCLVITLG
jgi:hypothetical protein